MIGSVLEVRALTKQYRLDTAVNQVSLSIAQGDIYGFIGQNGAGKTTLLRMIAGLIYPTQGDISLFGQQDEQGLAKSRKRIGCMIEGPAFFPKLSASENLEYYRIQRGIPEKNAVKNALELVNLTQTGKKQYRHFSMGMRQRLGVALAIMGNPDFLILDEPINGLDPVGIAEFREMIATLNRKHGMTLMVSSHILSELSQVATRYGIIDRGVLLKECSQQELETETKRCIMLRTNNAAKAATLLEIELGIKKIKAMPDNELRIYEYIDQPGRISSCLTAGGIEIHAIQEIGANLEEYFLGLINATGKRG